jgi:hypothetical protein
MSLLFLPCQIRQMPEGELLVRSARCVLDNLGSHKGKAVRNMIRNAGAHLMFLPPYSPDLNPIEQVFEPFPPPCAKAPGFSFRAHPVSGPGIRRDKFATLRSNLLRLAPSPEPMNLKKCFSFQ